MGVPKVLVFLAHWCPHCQREVPVLVDWLAEHGKPSDVDIYGIATGSTKDRPNFPPSAWLEKEGWDLPTVADSADGTAGMSFGLSAFPFFVALDADNDVVARGSGELSTEEWEGLLDEARSGPDGLRCGVLAAGLGTNLIFFGITLVAVAVASTPFVLARRNRRH